MSAWPQPRRPTDLATLLADDLDTSGGKNITAMTLWSWSRVYGADMSAAVTPEAILPPSTGWPASVSKDFST